MGRKILWIGAAAGLLAVCAGMMMQQERVPEGEFRIEGELTGVPDSTVLSLYRVDGNLLKRMQADTVIDGRFSFRLSLYRRTYAGFRRKDGIPRFRKPYFGLPPPESMPRRFSGVPSPRVARKIPDAYAEMRVRVGFWLSLS